MRRSTFTLTLALAASLTRPASAEPEAPTLAEVEAAVAAAGARYTAGEYAEALTLLDALSVQLGDAGRRAHPVIELHKGRCLARLGRPEDALTAYERVIRWADRVPEAAETHAHAVRFREALLATALGGLEVRCGPEIERVRLAGREEGAVDCPARWPSLPVGPHRVEPLDADGRVGRSTEVTVVAGRSTTVTVEADAAGRWRPGARLGAGVAIIGGETVYAAEPTPGSSFRIAATVESPQLWGWLSGQLELGVNRSVMSYTDTRAIDPAGTRLVGASPRAVDLTWWQVEAALLGRICRPPDAWSPCLALGVGVAGLIHAEDAFEGRAVESSSGRDQAHLLARGGLELRIPWGARLPFAGLHVAWSPWPGALQYEDGRLPQLRAWFDLGISF